MEEEEEEALGQIKVSAVVVLDQPSKQPLQGDIFRVIPKNLCGWGEKFWFFFSHPRADPSQNGILQLLGLSPKKLGEIPELWELCDLTQCDLPSSSDSKTCHCCLMLFILCGWFFIPPLVRSPF